MAGGEELADLIVSAVAVKLRAMEEVSKGFNADGDVTVYDRLIFMLGTLSRKYINGILDREPRLSDVERVIEIFRKHGVEVTPEEAVVMGNIRRFVAEKVKNVGKVLDEKLEMNSEALRNNKKKLPVC